MNELQSIYEARVERFSLSRKRYNQQLKVLSMIRLGVFLAAALGVYFYWNSWPMALGITLLGIVILLLLVSRHEDVKAKRNYYQKLIELNQIEIQVGQRQYDELPDGIEFLRDDHDYSRDIDLFGLGSFYQFINRTALREGSRLLAGRLTANSTQDIEKNQEGIQELAKMLDYRQEFEATARLLDNEVRPETVVQWSSTHKKVVPKVFSWLCYALFALSVMTIVLYSTGVLSGYWIVGCLLLGLTITGRYMKKMISLRGHLSQLEGFFTQYGKLLEIIESANFQSGVLREIKEKVETDGSPASSRLKEFEKMIVRLDQGYNMLMGIFVNGFGLWNLKQTYRIESWLDRNKDHIALWLDAVAQMDAYNSLGNFAYNHPKYVYPEISQGNFQLQAVELKHPLLDPNKAVGNDIHISSSEFFIITGANMAGKSTFLRTVSISLVMSNMGLPIAADSASYSPIKLITSMRTSDSLKDDESYFFSELKRLKFITDKVETEPYFIVLDEILKGTNSVDKAKGSRKLIEKLSNNQATGIIATHDLSLTEVAEEYDSITNYYFDAQIIDDELFFDYTFKNGVATNMNASFLLKKMGIV